MCLSSTVRALDQLRPDEADRAATEDALRLITQARRLIDAAEIRWNRRLVELAAEDPAVSPEHVNARSTQRSLRKATDAVRRSTRAAVAPVFDDAVAAGAISAEHLDAFVRGVHSLNKGLRPRLLELQHDLLRHARRQTPEDFAQRVRDEVRRIEGDGGKSRLAQQKRAARAKTWSDADGMWNLLLTLDPERALPVSEAVRKATERLFHAGEFDDAPEDPVARHQWLQASAIVELILQAKGTGTASDPAFVIVMDERTFTTGERRPDSRVDTGCELEIPVEVLKSWSVRAKLLPVVLDADGRVVVMGPKVSTPDELGDALLRPVSLDRGRSARYADARQQLAIRAMYRHCAIPGCRVPVNRCEIHHVVHWEHGGLTDLDNLLPVCRFHHDRIHQQQWLLELAPDRSLTVRRDGVVLMSTGPPATDRAAA